MSEKPLVSVILPVYNGAAYLTEAVRSVKNQSYGHIELCAVDDGSTDNSLELLNELNVDLVISQPNGGTAKARNTGILNTSGELVAFIDQDDIWTTDKLALQVKTFVDDPSIMYCLGMHKLYIADGMSVPSWAKEEWFDAPLPGWTPSAVILRREVFETLGMFDERFPSSSDTDYFFRLKDAKIPYYQIGQVVMHKRIHDQNELGAYKSFGRDIAHLLKRSLERRRKQGQ